MPKRKRAESESYIPGLTPRIIQNVAATNSYYRGQELTDDVIIDSMCSDYVEASIRNKAYEIEITFTEPVGSALDIEPDCTCPDDRDGACKHVCAVLLELVDDEPNAKKHKADPTGNAQPINKVFTDSEMHEAVEDLSKEQLVQIVRDSLSLEQVQTVVSKTLNSVRNEDVDLGHFKSEIYAALHQLDRLRPSQQFSMAHKVNIDLAEVIESARKYAKAGNSLGAMQILIAMAKSTASAGGIEGEVWKSLHSGGSIAYDIAQVMVEVIEKDDQLQSNARIKDAVQSVHDEMVGYCIEDYEEVLACFDDEQ